MRPISKRVIKGVKKDKCFICGLKQVELHHALYYAGMQMDEVFAIIPLCEFHHRGHNGVIWQDVREKCELHAIKEGFGELLIKYPKFDWEQRMLYLNKKYA